MPEPKRPLKVFLCHASADKPAVRDLYKRLTADGVDAWLDAENLIAGQNWQVEIPKAIRESDVVIVCLSEKSINREGYVQKEIKFALDAADEKPEGTIFIVPARLEECVVPDRLDMYHWVDLFEENGYDRLMRALRLRADKIGATLQIKKSWLPNISSSRQSQKKTPSVWQTVPQAERLEPKIEFNKPKLTVRKLFSKAALTFWGVFVLIAISLSFWKLLSPINQSTPTSQLVANINTPVIGSTSSYTTNTPFTTITPETNQIPILTPIAVKINNKERDLLPISIANADQMIKLYSFNLGSNLIRWSISPDGKNLITGHKVTESVVRYYVRIWDTLNGNEVKSIRMPMILNDIYSKDEGVFVTQCNKSTANLADEKSYDCTQGELFEMKMPSWELTSVSKLPGKVIGMTNDYQMVLVNTCNEWIQSLYYLGPRVMFSCNEDGLELWSMNGEVIKKYGVQPGNIYNPAIFSIDKQYFAIERTDGAFLYSTTTDNIVKLSSEALYQTPFVFHPNMETLIGLEGSSINIWQISDGILLDSINRYEDRFLHLALSVDGTLLASASDSEVIIWDFEKKTPIMKFDLTNVTYLVFSLDSTLLITLSETLSEVNIFGIEE